MSDDATKAAVEEMRKANESDHERLAARLAAIEETQKDLVKTATQGRAGLKVLLWVGGVIGAAGLFLSHIWEKIHLHN